MFFKKFPKYMPAEDTWPEDIEIKISYAVIGNKICIEFIEDPTGKLKGFLKRWVGLAYRCVQLEDLRSEICMVNESGDKTINLIIEVPVIIPHITQGASSKIVSVIVSSEK